MRRIGVGTAFLLMLMGIGDPANGNPQRSQAEALSEEPPQTLLAGTFASVEGYYKDVFMDSGYKLTSRTSLPAADALGLSMEYVAVGDTSSDITLQNTLMVSHPGIDDNGLLLYPDGAPRFRLIYVNGGDSTAHGSSLGEEGRQRIRRFFTNGGSYSGSCAGAFLAALHYNHYAYNNGPDGEPGTSDDHTPLTAYFHIWPGSPDAASFGGLQPELEAVPSMVDHPVWQMFPSLQDGWVNDCSFNYGPTIFRNDTGDLAEMAKTEFLARYNIPSETRLHLNASLIAYKKDTQTGRLVIIGCHPEGATSGEKLDLVKAMFTYALQGNGQPRLKASLNNDETRIMNDRTQPGHEPIGDKQYHHFTVDIPEGTTRLEILLDGTDGYDTDLFVRRGDFAFLGSADYASTSPEPDEQITLTNPPPGTWYVGVKLHTSVTYNANDYDNYYTGKIAVLNGISYSVRAAWGSDPVPTFADVPFDHPYHDEIEILYQNGYTAGCGTEPLRYCPEQTMTRAESAVFVERGVHTASYDPPAPASQVFADLSLDSWAAKWVNGLWSDQYTAGCGTDPLIYCPWQGHTRAEGCVFYLRMLRGANYEPPPPSQQTFVDVPLDAWYAKWVQAAYDAALLTPCQTSPELRFCPDDPLTRALAAYMMVQAKGLNLP